MTREQEMTDDEKRAEEYAQNIKYGTNDGCGMLRERLRAYEGYLAGIRAERERNRWIQCSERLPEELKAVVGYRNILGTHSVVYYSSAFGGFVFQHEPNMATDITHWMPLPKPPPAKGEE